MGNTGATEPTEIGRNSGLVKDAKPAQIQIARTRPKVASVKVVYEPKRVILA
jgi:hypothetical protein